VQVAALQADLAELEDHRARHEAALWRIEMLERDLAARDAERKEAVQGRDAQARAAVEASVRLDRALEDLEAERAALARAREARDSLGDQLSAAESELADLRDREMVLRGRGAHLEEALEASQAQAREARGDAIVAETALEALRERERELAEHVRLAADSRSWRLGHRLVRIARTLTFRRSVGRDGALEAAVKLVETPALPAGPVSPETDVERLERAAAGRGQK